MAVATENKPQEGKPTSQVSEIRDEDFEHVVQKLKDGDFDDWPNEAGFEGLTEVRGPVDLTVKGSIPAWAAGALYRVGPGQYTLEDTPVGTFRTTHWFDGFGQSHKFNIIADSGNTKQPVRVEYSSRRQSKDYVDYIKKNGRLPTLSFGQRQDPCVGLFGKVMSVWRQPGESNRTPSSDNITVAMNANVPGLSSKLGNVASPGHRNTPKNLWISTDAGHLKEISPDTLEPLGRANQQVLHPLLTGPMSCAHVQRDPETGDLFNYNLELGYSATYRIFRTNASTGTTDILATISQSDIKPAYIHSFFLSPSFVIFCVPSTHLGLMGTKVPWHGNIADAIEPFDDSKICKWFVVDRRGDRGVVATFTSPAGFFFHSINAFEEEDKTSGDTDVLCDVVEYPSTEVIRSFEIDVLLQNGGATKNFWGDEKRNRDSLARLVRHKFRVHKDGSSKAAQQTAGKVFEIKAPHVGELPTINPNHATEPYRYVYSLPNRGYSTLMDSIVKTDLLTRTTTFWDGPKGHTPGEAIFVPRPATLNNAGNELDEDDGVLLSVVLDGVGKSSYLLCLDAKTMKELGRAECGWAVGFGFHGMHTPLAAPGL